MCGYFCIGFFDFMSKDKSLLKYTNLFSANEYKENAKIIFLVEPKEVKMYCNVCSKYKKIKKLKYHIFL